MRLDAFYSLVAKIADTPKQKIGVDEVSRVMRAARETAQHFSLWKRARLAWSLFYRKPL